MSHSRLLQLMGVVREADPDLHAWLAGGYQRWREGEALDRALDLNGRGAKHAAEEALLRVADILDPASDCSPWALACKLADVLQHFKAHRWPRAKLTDTPDGLTALDRELWTSLKSSESVRCSPRRILDLLTERGRFCQTRVRQGRWVQDFLTKYRPPTIESELNPSAEEIR